MMKPLFYFLTIITFVFFSAFASGEEEISADETRLAEVELRSIFSLGGDVRFSLHDPILDRSFWIEPGQVRHDYEVIDFDVEKGLLVLALGEFEREVGLSQSRVASLQEESSTSSESSSGNGSDGDNQRGERRGGRRMSEEDREELERLGGLLQEARQASPRVEELHGNFVEIMADFHRMRRDFREIDRESEAFQELVNVRQDLIEEFRQLRRSTQEEIASIETLSAEDRDQLGERLHQVIWFQVREERRAAREER